MPASFASNNRTTDHPVRKRIGTSLRDVQWLSLVLLGSSLIAVSALVGIVLATQSKFVCEDLHALAMTRRLSIEVSRRRAAAMMSDGFDEARARFDGITASSHVTALARHQALFD